MDREFWIRRWEKGQTAFHQSEVEPKLISGFSQVQPTRVFVPLCGKSMDLKWLMSQGHEVIGIELSQMACREFFSENEIPYQNFTEGAFEVFQGAGITIYCGDFFNFQPEVLRKMGALYDRAALIAMPPDMRSRYAAHLLELIQKCSNRDVFYFLQIALEKAPPNLSNPPFSVSAQEIENLYGREFEIQHLSSERVDSPDESVITTESVYQLKRR